MNRGDHTTLRRVLRGSGTGTDPRPPVEAQRRNQDDELVRRRRTEEHDGAAAPLDDVRVPRRQAGSHGIHRPRPTGWSRRTSLRPRTSASPLRRPRRRCSWWRSAHSGSRCCSWPSSDKPRLRSGASCSPPGLRSPRSSVLILAIGTMALSPYLGKSLRIIGDDPVTATLFVVGSVAAMAGATLDNAAVGLHRGAAQLWRGSLSSLLKLAGCRRPDPLLDAHERRPDLRLGAGPGRRLHRVHADARVGAGPCRRRNPHSPSGTRPSVRHALSPASRAQSLDQFGLHHHPADRHAARLPVGGRLLLGCVSAAPPP